MKMRLLFFFALLYCFSSHAQIFTEVSTIQLTGLDYASAGWGDYNNDGLLDILLIGSNGTVRYSIIYKNNGNDSFTNINAGLESISYGDANWGDYDNDGDLDIIEMGSGGDGSMTKIYRNDGNDIFYDIQLSLPATQSGSASWGDLDNDGDLDFLLTGFHGTAVYSSPYLNVGNDNFTVFAISQIGGRSNSAHAFGDFDNDNDLDVLFCGHAGYAGSGTVIYRNNSDETFTTINANLTGVSSGDVAWGDYDNDGDLDILVSGSTSDTPYRATEIFKNNSGIFTNIYAGLIALNSSSAVWGDYNNDGNPDVLVTGYSDGGVLICKIYDNNGDDNFSDSEIEFPGVNNGTAVWGDYDNDNDLDILLTGDSNGTRISKIYRNNTSQINNPPDAPTNLTASVTATSNLTQAALNWSEANDTETSSSGLTYNVFIRNENDTIVMPHSNPDNGFVTKPAMGNAQLDTEYLVNDLGVGTYYWKVQAVDNSFIGGTFSAESSFLIVEAPETFSEVVCSGYSNPALTANGENIRWYADEARTNPEATGNSFIPAVTDIGVHTWYVTQTIDGFESYSAPVTLTIIESPEANAGENQSIPHGTTTQLSGSASGGSGDYSYLWQPENMVSNPAIANPFTENLYETVIFTFTVTDNTTTCQNAAQTTITITGEPLSVDISTNSNTICYGYSAQLEAVASGGSGNYTYSWTSEPSGFVSEQSVIDVSPTETTIYSVTVNDGYNQTASSLEITVYPLPTVFDVSGSGSYCAGSGGLTVSLSHSEIGINYQLQKNGINEGFSLQGTGELLAWENLTAGTYTVFATNTVTGCHQDMNGNAVITENPLPTVNAGENQSIPHGTTTQLSGSASGGSGDYSYLWQPENMVSNPAIATPFTENLYETVIFTFTVTDNTTTCQNAAQTRVTITGEPLSVDITVSSNTICYGYSAQLEAVASGGSGNYTYSWTSEPAGFVSEQSVIDVSPTETTIYSVTVNDGYNQTASSLEITVYPLPTVFDVSGSGSYCAGSGGLTVSLSHSEIGINYQLQKNGINEGFTLQGTGELLAWENLTAGTYTVFATNSVTGCHQDMNGNAVITENPLPTVNAGENQSIPHGTTTQLSGSASGGSGDYSYLWQPENMVSNPAIATPFTENLYETVIFTFTVTDNTTTCQNAAQTTVTITGEPLSVDITVSSNTICYGYSAQLEAVASGGSGNYTYSWTSEPSGFVSEQSVIDVSPTETTIYSVTVNDGYNQTASSLEITVYPLPTVFDVSGSGAYCAGSGGLTVSLSHSEIGINYQLQKDGTNEGFPLQGTGELLAWQNLTAGTYTVFATNTVTGCHQDMNGNAVITENPLPTVNAGENQSIPHGTTTQLSGSASGGSGDYSYLWQPENMVSNPAIATPFTENLYETVIFTFTVTDNTTTCQNAAQTRVTITGEPLSVDITVSSNTICYGYSAQLEAVASGGSGNYTYSWTSEPAGFVSEQSVIDVSPTETTIYSVTVNDGYNQTASSLEITVYPLPTVFDVSESGSYCAGSGGLTVSLSHSEIGINYQLQKDGINEGFPLQGTGELLAWENLTAGTYTVFATNTVTGCHQDMNEDAVITENPLPTVNAGENQSIPHGTTTQLSGSASGGSGDYSYLWQPENMVSNPAIATPFTENLYETVIFTFTVTDNITTCQNAAQTTVTITGEPLSVDITVSSNTICYGYSAQLEAVASGGSGNYTYSWTSEPAGFVSEQSVIDVSPTETTIYSVTVNDGYNQTASSLEITVYPLPTVFDVSGSGAYCAGSGGLTVSLSHSEIGINYQLQKDGTNEGFPLQGTGELLAWENLTAGTYTVFATNTVTGCHQDMNGNAEISIIDLPSTFELTGSGLYCQGSNGLTFNLSGSETGIRYYIRKDGIIEENFVSGTGNSLQWYNQLHGTYKIIAKDDTEKCSIEMSGTVEITEVPNPTADAGENIEICIGDETILNASGSIGDDLAYNWNEGANNQITYVVSPNFTTVYKLMVLDKNGCSATDETMVVVHELPEKPIINSQDTICPGDEIACDNCNGMTYQWQFNNTKLDGEKEKTIQVTNPGYYSIKVTDNITNCGNTSEKIYISLYETTEPLLIKKWNDVLICDNSHQQFLSYQWFKNNKLLDGETRQFLYEGMQLSGSYFVEVTDINSCKTRSEIIRIQKKKSLRIYPNPNHHNFTIDLYNEQNGDITISVYNSLGKEVKRVFAIKDDYYFFYEMSLSGFGSGIFFLKIDIDSKEQYTEKLIIK